ncbi:MAG: flagellar basal body rod protein FlgB [Eubacteriaceae bacterium]
MGDLSYDLIKKGLDVSSMRQKTISSNIANVNTPNYKVNRVEFEELLLQYIDDNGIDMTKTDDKHFGYDSIEDIEAVVQKRENTFLNDNGNNVDIDLEMTNLAANEIYYNALIEQMNRKLGNLNYVINK